MRSLQESTTRTSKQNRAQRVPVTAKQVTAAVARAQRRNGGQPVTWAQLLSELLGTQTVVKDTWLEQPVDEAGDAQQSLLSVLGELLAAAPSTSPWADALGETYRTSQAMALLGVRNRQALANRVSKRNLLAVLTSDRHQLYPAWQFVDGSVVAGLGDVLKVLTPDVVDSWTLASWLRRPQPESSGRSVVDALLAGDQATALRAARRAAARWSR